MNRQKINQMSIVATILLFSLSIVAQADQPAIYKKETLQPFDYGHKYYIRIYNEDDTASAAVNGHSIGPYSAGQDSGLIDITNYISQGSNNLINFYLNNNVAGWSYGFQIFEDSNANAIWGDACGIYAVDGCMNDLHSGFVYQADLSFHVQSPLISFARGNDNALWYRYYDGSSWSGWVSLGGILNSDPDSAKLNGEIYVFVRGTDNALWYRKYDGTFWSNWISLGGAITTGPGAS